MLLKRGIYTLSTVPIYTPLNQPLGKSTWFVLIKEKPLGNNMLSPTLQQALQIVIVTEIF